MFDYRKSMAVLLIASAAALGACNKRESAAEVTEDVTKAQAAKVENVNEAMKERSEVAAETAADAVSADPDDRGDAIEERAEAAYNVSIAKAEGDKKVARQACDALPSNQQSGCNKIADGVYESAKAQAKTTLEAAKAHSNAVQKLDNK